MGKLRERRGDFFLIAADTALPALMAENINPDAVVSIDGQHISYYHFLAGLPGDTLLFTDLASPPLVVSRSAAPRFFSGGHPLTRFISQVWRAFPEVDTSGANVTYAALSLAEKLGARSIEIFGADFSYPLGMTYARGTYIYPHFEIRQNRFSTFEALFSAFLYRTPLDKIQKDGGWYYETASLRFYRERLEEKCLSLEAAVHPAEGMGAPIRISGQAKARAPEKTLRLFSPGAAKMRAADFLLLYREKIKKLPVPGKGRPAWLSTLSAGEHTILTTLLPATAAIKRRKADLPTGDLIEETKSFCLRQIDGVLKEFSGKSD
jgi:hypothetical protein